MSARQGLLAAALLGRGCAPPCGTRDRWSDPAPPARITGGVWYVGTCGITALLVTSPAGHVLVDGATAEAAPGIVANIRGAGFARRDVRWIVSSHPHFDHVGGLDKAERLPCGILLTPHPSSSNLFERTAERAPLHDAASCRAYTATARERSEARLAKEHGQ